MTNTYEEDYECTIKPDEIEDKIVEVINAHPQSEGWVIGAPRLENVSAGNVRLVIHLIKEEKKANFKKL